MRFEKQLTHVDDPLSPPVVAEDGTLVSPSENIMQSCYQISRLCQTFRKAVQAIVPDNPDVGPWDSYEGPPSLLDRIFATGGQTIATQTEPRSGGTSSTTQTEASASISRTNSSEKAVLYAESGTQADPPAPPPTAAAKAAAATAAAAAA